jgi:hypothetical protein
MLHIFSIFDEKSALKGIVFDRMLNLCELNRQLKIIVDNVKNIEEISHDWAMTVEEKRELFKSCATALDRNNEPVAAFSVMAAYLKLFQKSSDSELSQHNVEREAKRCVLLAIKVPTVIDFKDILELTAVKYLQSKSKDVFDFMSLFTSTDTKQFS